MKVEIAKKTRPFVVLSLINCCSSSNNSRSVKRLFRMPKPAGLRLFTKTFTKRKTNKNRNDQNNRDELPYPRPLTATLDKPQILNIKLISQIDMSTMRKEFLNISNLCHLPLILTMKKRPKTTKTNRPLSLPSTVPPPSSNNNCDKSEKRPETVRNDPKPRIIPKKRNKTQNKTDENGNYIDKTLKKNPLISELSDDNNNNNNNKTFRIPRKRIVNKLQNNHNDNIVKSSSSTALSIKLPEPCKTCGRPDQPERFHSHPATPLRPNRKQQEPPKMKSTVTKPVAIKYKSKQQNGGDKRALAPPPNFDNNKTANLPTPTSAVSTSRCKSGKRTLTCYICGREFGTASLPLHEPKCLQKWERENADLPRHLQRKRPVKPDCSPNDLNEWNENAWKASQANLVPCPNCGRTFYPDRLAVHQRSCKNVQNNNSKLPIQKPITTTAPISPLLGVECYICKKQFGEHSINIHEKQCLKKWHLENDALPIDIRTPAPVKGAKTITQAPSEQKTTRKPPLLPCYICGKQFTISSVRIHEPQCLKKWQNENDKLPPNKRQLPPTKPDVIVTRDGKIDLDALIDASWQSHLTQLVRCKYCSRTFNPDRVEVHERSCKGG